MAVSPHGGLHRSTRSARFLDDVNKRTEGIGKAAWQLEDTQQDRLIRASIIFPVHVHCIDYKRLMEKKTWYEVLRGRSEGHDNLQECIAKALVDLYRKSESHHEESHHNFEELESPRTPRVNFNLIQEEQQHRAREDTRLAESVEVFVSEGEDDEAMKVIVKVSPPPDILNKVKDKWTNPSLLESTITKALQKSDKLPHGPYGEISTVVEGTPVLQDGYPTNPEAREAYFEAAEAEVDYRWALIILLILTVFETPAWCNTGWTTDFIWVYIDPHEQCAIEAEGHKIDPANVLLSTVPYMPLGWGIVFELYLIFKMARKLLLEYHLQVEHFQPMGVEYYNLKVIYFGLFMVALEIVDAIHFMLYKPSWRLAFIARTGYLCLMPAVRRLGAMVVAVMDQFFSIGIFFAAGVLFAAWIVYTLFDDVDGVGMDGEPINKGLDTFRHTLNTMAVAGTTDDFVACFLRAYTAMRWTGFIWIIFLVLVQVLLLSLVLDSLVAAYTEYAEKTEEETTQEKIYGIFASFQTLSEATKEGEEVSKPTFLDFVREFSRSPRTRRIKAATANIIFAAVDKDNSEKLDKYEFCNICGVMQYDFWTTPVYSSLKDRRPDIWNSGWFQKWLGFYSRGDFDFLMNCVLMVNLFLVVIESSYDISGLPEPAVLQDLELWFSLIYVTEVVLKLSVCSWAEYVSLRSNQFDFLTTWLLLASSVADLLMEGNTSSEVKRYMNILRLLRLLRVMKQLKNFPAVTLMVETIYRLVLASKDILTLLGVVVFFFTTLSVQLWGGLLYKGNPKLEETEYEENKYWVFNFHDVPMAFGLWVVMLLCEYVPVFPEAIEKTSKHPWSWIIFVIFYIFAVSVIFELVKAFTIEIFMTLKKKVGQQKPCQVCDGTGNCKECRGKGFIYTKWAAVVPGTFMDDKLVVQRLDSYGEVPKDAAMETAEVPGFLLEETRDRMAAKLPEGHALLCHVVQGDENWIVEAFEVGIPGEAYSPVVKRMSCLDCGGRNTGNGDLIKGSGKCPGPCNGTGKTPEHVFEPIKLLSDEFKKDDLTLQYRIIGDESMNDRIVDALTEMYEEGEEQGKEED